MRRLAKIVLTFCCITSVTNLQARKENLREKVERLEEKLDEQNDAIRELQRSVDKVLPKHSKRENSQKFVFQVESKTNWSCYIKKSSGAAYGTGPSRVAAAAGALQKCGNGFECKESKLVCDHNTQKTKKIIPIKSNETYITPTKDPVCHCMVRTFSGKTFIAREKTKNSATGKVLSLCGKDHSCKANRVKCSCSSDYVAIKNKNGKKIF